MKRVCVSVDLISVFGAVKSAYNGSKVDYSAYLEKVKTLGTIHRAMAYGAYINDEANNFITCLNSVGFEPKYVAAAIYDDRPNIKRTDRLMDMVVDILRIIDRIDIVVISTLNTNIIPFINYLKEKGIVVVLYSCNVKRDLKLSANMFWPITEDILEVQDANIT